MYRTFLDLEARRADRSLTAAIGPKPNKPVTVATSAPGGERDSFLVVTYWLTRLLLTIDCGA
jgi:hypothetical protein